MTCNDTKMVMNEHERSAVDALSKLILKLVFALANTFELTRHLHDISPEFIGILVIAKPLSRPLFQAGVLGFGLVGGVLIVFKGDVLLSLDIVFVLFLLDAL